MVYLLLLVLITFHASWCQFGEQWAQFKSTFKRSYLSYEEQTYRKGVWEGNIEHIAFQNAQNYGYRLAMNNFTDRTSDEVQSTLGQIIGFINVRVNALQLTSPKVSASATSFEPPISFDWRSSNKVTSVKSQLNCGSCWAFAAVANAESLLAIKYNVQVDLSEQYVVECSGASSCSGGWIDEAMKLIIKDGAPKEAAYPYRGYGYTPGICQSSSHQQLPPDSAMVGYFNVSDLQLKQMLMSSPVAVLVYAEVNFRWYQSGVYSCADEDPQPSQMNHAVLIVGYDQDNNYIVKNSWGQTWGDRGFAKINSTRNCGVRLFVYQIQSSMTPVDNSTTPDPNEQPNNNSNNNSNSNNSNNSNNNNSNDSNNTTPPNNNSTNNNSRTVYVFSARLTIIASIMVLLLC